MIESSLNTIGNVAHLEPVLATATGVAAYVLYFRRGERHLHPWRYVVTLVLGILLLWSHKWHWQHRSMLGAACEAFTLSSLFLGGLYASLLIYRLFLNPLNKFPGPLAARLSKLYLVQRNSKSNLHGQRELYDLHQTYGPYVRIGPNDLSVVDPEGMKVVLGPHSKCRKSAWYGQDAPYISTNTTRDRAAHDRRRRLLTPAFTDQSLRGYAVRVQKYHDQLISRIDSHVGQPMDITKWFILHGFDIMGDLVFNQSFDMLESGEKHWTIEILGEGLYPQGFAFPPWLYRVFATLPGMGAGYRRFVAFTSELLENRIPQQGKTTHPDIMHPLIQHFQQLSPADKKTALPLLQGDSRMLIVGGSDSTSTTLTHLFYRFCSEAGLVERLREELAPLVPNPAEVSYADVRSAQLLHGCINETLRLHYPAPSGFFRKTPEEGIFIGDTFIPADTNVQLPPYVMALGKQAPYSSTPSLNLTVIPDENIYERCREFVPERWYSRPDMVKQKDAFMPFLAGSESCIGKQLAYIQLSVITSQIIMQFDVEFAPGEDGTKLIEESKDLAMLHLEEFNVVFTRRA